jgi:hypothetical protein
VRVQDDPLGVSACLRVASARIRTRNAPDVGIVAVSAVVKFVPTDR